MTADGLKELLGIWSLGPEGKAIPQPDDFVRLRLDALCPDEDTSALFTALRQSGWIEVLANGDWTLTAAGMAARPPESGAPAEKAESKADREAAWRQFRVLCNYYADCVQLQEKEVEYLFDNQLNTGFFLPALPMGWLAEEGKIRIQASSQQRVALSHVANGAGDALQAFIGYPLTAFRTSTGSRAYAPLLLFPVDITRDARGTWATIQREGVDVNQKWLRYNMPPDDLQYLLRTITYPDGEKQGMVDPEAALSFFANRFRAQLDPDRLCFDIWNGEQVLNSAALFLENGLKYSKSLKQELKRIRDVPAEVLDGTALAYVFRDPPLPNRNEGPEDVAFDFIAANSEQHEAVDEALNHPANKVTGPPGTGKSQVAVNLIANLLIRGRSVLFTSKNHKAVHAIRDKVAALGQDLPLVQFCSQSDGGAGATWYGQDIDAQIGRLLRARADLNGRGAGAVLTVGDAADCWRDLKPSIRALEALRDKASAAEGKLEGYRRGLERDKVRPDAGLLEALGPIRLALADPPKAEEKNKPWWKRLLDPWRRPKVAQQPKVDPRARLRALLPDLCDEFASMETLRGRVERVADNLAGYFRASGQLQEIAREEAALPPYERMLEKLSAAYGDIRDNQKSALVERLGKRAAETPDNVLEDLRNATAFLKHAKLPFLADLTDPKQNALAQEAFRNYSRIFPAWACTLLSLGKAAPCIPGVFDRVIIDEASQCEIPPIIPALYRARGVTVVGDPRQFPPVITLRETRNAQLRIVRHGLGRMEDERFDFCNQTAYSVVPVRPVELREHFRCHADIADYCNDVFYNDHLRVRTDESKLVFPAAEGFRAGRIWRNVVDSPDGELEETARIFEELVAADFQGSVGVVTPFRSVANALQTKLARFSGKLAHFSPKEDVSTANGFQGGERDLMVFVLAFTSQLQGRKVWYTTSDENRYIFNVAVSRARACLVVVGDRERAAASGFAPMERLTREPRPCPRRFDSPPEKMLHDALVAAGFAPVPQYPLAGRFLDLALPEEKLDIEIDGEAYHLGDTGNRKQSDVFRDMVVQCAGWRVQRFWARQVLNDAAGCVAAVRNVVESLRKPKQGVTRLP